MREVVEGDVTEGNITKTHHEGETSWRVEVIGGEVARGDIARDIVRGEVA